MKMPTLPIYQGADIRDAVAFAIEHGDNCSIPEGYANRDGWQDHEDDWLSDWGAFMADRVLKELYDRGYMIVRRQGHGTEIRPDVLSPT